MQLDIFDINNYPAYSELCENTRSKKFSAAFGLQFGEKIFVTAGLNRFALYVTGDYVNGQEAVRQLNAYAQKPFVFLPAKQEVLLFKTESGKSRFERFVTLFKILNGDIGGVVTTPEALGQLFPSVEFFKKSIFKLSVGDVIDLTDFVCRLVSNGLTKVDRIEALGQFTVRGDIVDVFVPQYDSPVRVDFFDDIVESIKLVDKETLLSMQKIDCVDFFALKEIFEEQTAIEAAKKEAVSQRFSSDAMARNQAILSALETNGDNGWLFPFSDNSLLSDYLPSSTLVVWDEPKVLEEKLNRTYSGYTERFASLLSKGEVLPSHFGCLFDRGNLLRQYEQYQQLSLQNLPYAGTFFSPQKITNFKSSAIFNYKFNLQQLVSDIKNWSINGYQVGIFAADETQGEALSARLDELGALVGVCKTLPQSLLRPAVLLKNVTRGFVSHSNKLVFIGTADVFARSPTKKLKAKRENVFLNLQAGDYAVHEVHGIGLCDGVVTRTGSFGTKDYIKLLYRDGDTVYVPVENTNMLSRYSGSDVAPRLSRLGGAEFEKVKAKVKLQIKEMAFDLVKLYAARKHARGFCYKLDNYLAEEFDAGFGFSETPDQIKCEEEIDADLISDKIMDRLLVGDVGFGKTEVALRAAFKVVSNGKQVAFMAPTTILSEQHYNTIKERCAPFDIKVECVNRFRSQDEQKTILDKVAEGKADILVGTHRLLGKDVRFKNLGFLVLDEEQRFGVEHKEKIKVLKNNVDVLSMSATPIPRTLYMALSGMKDISIISTPPKERIAVETFVVQESDALLRDIILREKDRQGQVFLLYNRVEGIEFFVERIRRLVPEVSVTYAHGQMNELQLENNVFDFSNGKFDVLVCTTIIENGIDMPNANTIVVFDADRLGLSQLYQLRGRVGRGDKAAYAYFVYREDKILSDNALKRLSGIMEYSDLGSGFKIAMKDLEIRGAGNVLGREQHGHLIKVGYDMYVKLLNEAMGEIEGKRINASFETTMEVAVNAFVPQDYVLTKERMTLYQRIAEISSDAELDTLLSELSDIYGPPPKETQLLLQIALLKSMANRAGFSKVEIDAKHAKLCFWDRQKLNQKSVFDAVDAYKSICKLDLSKELAVIFDFCDGDTEKNMQKIKNFLSLLL